MDTEPDNLAKSRLGRKPQAGGGIAIFIGLLLLLMTPPAAPGESPGLHQMAKVFIVIGAFLFAAGTLARWFSVE
jgi:hypothetical protein